jgi:hypothetical protein
MTSRFPNQSPPIFPSQFGFFINLIDLTFDDQFRICFFLFGSEQLLLLLRPHLFAGK